ncbi:hypothetical protein [Paraburkholderia sp. GAS42]|jgi:hypothetical protein|uniref:hypothetical protein n=1 Tax=Paraburkholderia sp. GAS42 TaxID=3035135 RepID=UPI003D25DFC0
MRKPLQVAAAIMALGLSGNATADPNIDRTDARRYDSRVTPDAKAPQESFSPAGAVALGRLDESVSRVSAADGERTTDNSDDTRESANSSRSALHPPTPDSASPLSDTFAAPRVVSDAAASLSGRWLTTGQYAISFFLSTRN